MKINNLHSWAFTMLFAGVIFLPITLQVLKDAIPETLKTKQVLDLPPEYHFHIHNGRGLKGKIKGTYLDAVYFVNNFAPWFSSHFPMKTKFLQLFQAVKTNIFCVDPFPDKVITGSNGWLFAGDDFNRGLSEQLGYERMKNEEIEDFAQILSNLDGWCKENGCFFIFLPIQEKTSFYHEFVPLKKSSQPTTLELILKKAAEKGIKTIDVRKSLASGNQMQLYRKEDTHWNSIGAWLVYNQLMDTINTNFWRVKKLNPYEIENRFYILKNMDLAKLLNRESNSYEFLVLPANEHAQLIDKQLKIPDTSPPEFFNNWETRFQNAAESKKILVFADSYFVHLAILVKESFNETVIIRQPNPDTNLIRIEKPDIVIFEVLERLINDNYETLKLEQKTRPQ